MQSNGIRDVLGCEAGAPQWALDPMTLTLLQFSGCQESSRVLVLSVRVILFWNLFLESRVTAGSGWERTGEGTKPPQLSCGGSRSHLRHFSPVGLHRNR